MNPKTQKHISELHVFLDRPGQGAKIESDRRARVRKYKPEGKPPIRGKFYIRRGDEIISGPHFKNEAEQLLAAKHPQSPPTLWVPLKKT